MRTDDHSKRNSTRSTTAAPGGFLAPVAGSLLGFGREDELSEFRRPGVPDRPRQTGAADRARRLAGTCWDRGDLAGRQRLDATPRCSTTSQRRRTRWCGPGRTSVTVRRGCRARFSATPTDASFVVSDPDVVPDPNARSMRSTTSARCSDRYPEIDKVGFGLRIDDLPDTYPLASEVRKWEQRFWTERSRTGSVSGRHRYDVCAVSTTRSSTPGGSLVAHRSAVRRSTHAVVHGRPRNSATKIGGTEATPIRRRRIGIARRASSLEGSLALLRIVRPTEHRLDLRPLQRNRGSSFRNSAQPSVSVTSPIRASVASVVDRRRRAVVQEAPVCADEDRHRVRFENPHHPRRGCPRCRRCSSAGTRSGWRRTTPGSR